MSSTRCFVTPLVALAIMLAACSDDTEPGGTGGTGSGTGGGGGSGNAGATGGTAGQGGMAGAAGVGGDCAAIPEPAPSWLPGYLQEVVGRLTGELEISPGVSLTERETVESRGLAQAYLVNTLEAEGYAPEVHDYGSGGNVWALLDAAEPGAPTLVLGAHYDTMPDCPGANDNATGVALVVAAARYLRQVECRSLNVLVALFDEEELGRVGSDAFAGMLAADGYDLIAAHTVDQLGWDADDDLLIEVERPDAGLFEQYEATIQAGGLGIPLLETDTGGTDHVSFRDHGFAAVGLTEGFASGDTTPHWHLPTDTYDTVDLDYLVSATTLVNFHFARLVTGQATTRR